LTPNVIATTSTIPTNTSSSPIKNVLGNLQIHQNGQQRQPPPASHRAMDSNENRTQTFHSLSQFIMSSSSARSPTKRASFTSNDLPLFLNSRKNEAASRLSSEKDDLSSILESANSKITANLDNRIVELNDKFTLANCASLCFDGLLQATEIIRHVMPEPPQSRSSTPPF